MEIKRLDRQGRMVIPKIELEDRIEILPRKKLNISRFFDIVEVEIEGEDLEKGLHFSFESLALQEDIRLVTLWWGCGKSI